MPHLVKMPGMKMVGRGISMSGASSFPGAPKKRVTRKSNICCRGRRLRKTAKRRRASQQEAIPVASSLISPASEAPAAPFPRICSRAGSPRSDTAVPYRRAEAAVPTNGTRRSTSSTLCNIADAAQKRYHMPSLAGFSSTSSTHRRAPGRMRVRKVSAPLSARSATVFGSKRQLQSIRNATSRCGKAAATLAFVFFKPATKRS
eukprot:scaffold1638_cov258-Pinguiococcus_pyrenoidosus.AAC.47